MDNLELFADPWEHIRLLGDRRRNEALLALLARRAPGRRVLEVGAGTGLWSCVAARLGATRVIAVEPTAMADVARELVRENGLQAIVEVVEATLQELPPEPVDLIYSELLNADPFYEEVVDIMRCARAWLGPNGHMAPRRLRVYAQLVEDADASEEFRVAQHALSEVGTRFGVNVGPLLDGLAAPGPYRYLSSRERLASDPVLLWDIDLTCDSDIPTVVHVELSSQSAGPIGGACTWFEADLDDGITMHNRPGQPSHWGQFVSGWARSRTPGLGGSLRLEALVEDDSLVLKPIDED